MTTRKADIYDLTAAKAIQEVRFSKGISRHGLADAVGVTHQQFQKYEKGINRITIGRFIHICDALDINASELMDRIQENKIDEACIDNSRMLLEMSKAFQQIPTHKQKKAIVTFIREMVNE